MAGLPQFGDLSDSKAIWEQLTKGRSQEQMDNRIKAFAPIEPRNFVGLAPPSTVMFQFAGNDHYVTPGLAKIYWDAAREPKLQRRYDTSHELNDPRAQVDRDQFLEQQLGLEPVTPLILQQMGIKAPPARRGAPARAARP
jgi:hypothetical protein